MRRKNALQRRHLLASLIVVIMLSPGCLSLVTSREMMEGMRAEYEEYNRQSTEGWAYTFDTQNTQAVQYTNQTDVQIDPTVSEFEILFDATFPWSDTVNDTFPGIQDLVDVRYAEASLWEPGEYPSGTPFWTERTTSNYEQTRFRYVNEASSPFKTGNWQLTVDAQGIGIETPVDILDVYDSFTVYVTVTRPCVHFDEVHEDGECTDLILLE